ncbi:MAG: peptide deformylase [Clostridia bacterium]|nr:peptide deformylase [Clostridia bacterium]
MIREIVRDPLFLAQKSEPATEADRQVILDLLDTLRASRDRCVGMAANMIGEKKRIIAICQGPLLMAMVNPRLVSKSEAYEAEEGCLSLDGVRRTRRYRKITVAYQDQLFRQRTGSFEGFAAQIIQHEMDHCEGILI